MLVFTEGDGLLMQQRSDGEEVFQGWSAFLGTLSVNEVESCSLGAFMQASLFVCLGAMVPLAGVRSCLSSAGLMGGSRGFVVALS